MKRIITRVSKPHQSNSNVGNIQVGLLNTSTNISNLQVRLWDADARVDYAILNAMFLQRDSLSLERRVIY